MVAEEKRNRMLWQSRVKGIDQRTRGKRNWTKYNEGKQEEGKLRHGLKKI